MLRRHDLTTLAACVVVAVSFCGCSSIIKKPNKANIELRKKNEDLEAKVAELRLQHQGDTARIKSLETRVGTLPTLPSDRLAKLFTTHDINLLKLTGGADLDPSKPGQEGLKVHVAPIDQAGDPIKAAGAFKVEAFDLSRGNGGMKIGEWNFDAQATRAMWISVLNRYNYVLPCRWQTPPAVDNLHLEVTFDDELTQTRFKKSIDVNVELPQTRPAE